MIDINSELQCIAERWDYSFACKDENPFVVILGEHHYREENMLFQPEVVRAIRPAYVLLESKEARKPIEVPLDLTKYENQEIVPLLEASREVGAKVGGCTMDRARAIKKYLKPYPELKRALCTTDEFELIRQLRDAIKGGYATKHDLKVGDQIRRVHFEDGFNDEVNYAIAYNMNTYGRARMLTIGIVGAGHAEDKDLCDQLRISHTVLVPA